MRVLLLAAAKSSNTRSFVAGFSPLGHEVHVGTVHPGAIPEATVHVLGNSSSAWNRWPFVAALPAARRLHRRLRPDLVVGYYASSYGVLAALLPGPRVVATAGGDIFAEAQGTALRRVLVPRLSRFALSRADLVLCWGGHLAAEASRLGARTERILTLPRGIDTSLFRPPESAPESASTIVSTRALDPFYRQDLLVEAVAALRREGVRAVLELIGDGPAQDALRGLAVSLGIDDDVRFPGRLSPDRVAQRLRAAAVYASFPRSEGVSASLLEAMATGLVPVVGDLPASREWIRDGANGLLVAEPLAVETIARALRAALTDRALRRTCFADNPPEILAKASRESNSRKFAQAFSRLVSERSRPG